jgi:uncharacterized repeat protein (TIGR02543 family)
MPELRCRYYTGKRILLRMRRKTVRKEIKTMKNKAFKTKLLTVLLTLCMLLSLVPMTAATAFAANTTTVTNETELTAALNNADCTEIKLGSNIEITGKLYVERTVTLDLNGHTLSCSSENTGIIWVRKNGNLAIKDSGTGGKIDGQEKNCGIFIKGGVLTLESGSIVNCYEKIIDEYSGDGAAVDLETNGQFIMNGGAIEDCRAGDDGGAIDIGSGCTFIMNGGAIKNCKATKNGGAVIVKDKAKFEMNDGLIEGCSVTTTDGTGGGVYIANVGRFVMSGGTIKDCIRYFSDYYGYIGNGVAGETFSKAEIVLKGGTFDNCGTFGCTIDTHTVTFDSDGGSDVDQQEICNTSAIKPSDPKKDGYDFAGWYLGDTQYTFDTKITTDITLKAHWTPTSASTAITAATIQDVNFNYQSGDAPRATAAVAAADQGKYRIADEWWQELNENDEPVAIWHSDDGIYSTLPTITAFESGKKYVYSILLLPERGYDFGREVAATVNGSTVTAVPGTDGYLSLPNVKTITPTAASHTHSYGTEWKCDGTNHWHECECGDKADIAAHSASEWIVDTAATEIADGAKHKECTVCKKVLETAPIPATGSTHTHSYGTDWKYDSTNHWHECECGDKADTAAHSFQWVIDKAATKEATGIKHEECTVCGAKRSENTVIDKLPDGGNTGNTGSGDNNTDKPGKDDSTKSPQTGDSSNLIGWLAALFVSGGVLTVLGIASRKKSKNALK